MAARGKPGARAQSRGQPVTVLLAILAGWIALRVVTFHAPQIEQRLPVTKGVPVQLAPAQRQSPPVEAVAPATPAAHLPDEPLLHRWQPDEPATAPEPSIGLPHAQPPVSPAPASPPEAEPARMAVGQTMLLAAGLAGMPVPPVLRAYVARMRAAEGTQPGRLVAAPLPVPPAGRAIGPSRWSADGWLLWRDDSSSPLVSGRPAYGRSQAGAVVRFDLAQSSSHRPQAYLRGSVALVGAREKEAAVGLSARPLGKLPVRVAGEVRVGETVTGTQVRPAAFAVTEIPPVSLPGNAHGEVYAQAGYVGGTYATGFVDGQVRIDRPVASLGRAELRAGAGTWGGAQKHAARLDVGPTASIGFDIGQTRGRLAADYRFRVAGDARPASGPALTLSAGF